MWGREGSGDLGRVFGGLFRVGGTRKGKGFVFLRLLERIYAACVDQHRPVIYMHWNLEVYVIYILYPRYLTEITRGRGMSIPAQRLDGFATLHIPNFSIETDPTLFSTCNM